MSNTKTVLISLGRAAGIGLATSRQLAAGGAHVVMVSRDPEPARSKPITYTTHRRHPPPERQRSLTGAGEQLAMEAFR